MRPPKARLCRHLPLLILLTACTDAPHDSSPRDSAVTCPEGEVLDSAGCMPEACGVGTWGNLPVDGGTVYVDVTATGAADGSAAAPFPTIQAGLDLAAERKGGLVAVAAGTYLEYLTMGSGHDAVTLAGRCRELVTVDGSEGADTPAIQIIGERKTPEIAIEGVTVTGGDLLGPMGRTGDGLGSPERCPGKHPPGGRRRGRHTFARRRGGVRDRSRRTRAGG